MNGIDISEYQRNINLSLVDCDFVIVKATEGKTYSDPFFFQHIENAKKLGKLLGFYHFARPENNNPHDEVLNFLNSVRGYIGEGIPFLIGNLRVSTMLRGLKHGLTSFIPLRE